MLTGLERKVEVCLNASLESLGAVSQSLGAPFSANLPPKSFSGTVSRTLVWLGLPLHFPVHRGYGNCV